MQIGVIVPAAGSGQRFGGAVPKQYCDLAGKPILVRTVEMLRSAFGAVPIVVAVDPQWLETARHLLDPLETIVTIGGSTRQESVQMALSHPLLGAVEIVVVHDAVRPLASPNLARQVVDAAIEYGAAVPVVLARDTVKLLDEQWRVETTLARGRIGLAQTPQAFHRELLVQAHQEAQRDHLEATDDASIVEYAGFPVVALEGEQKNLKITTPLDARIAEVFLTDSQL